MSALWPAVLCSPPLPQTDARLLLKPPAASSVRSSLESKAIKRHKFYVSAKRCFLRAHPPPTSAMQPSDAPDRHNEIARFNFGLPFGCIGKREIKLARFSDFNPYRSTPWKKVSSVKSDFLIPGGRQKSIPSAWLRESFCYLDARLA